jgi:ssDNA-binding Zn-finger/Zn-ribbon topoisomerase 1
VSVYRVSVDCPLCGSPLTRRSRHKDGSEFVGCNAYPRCKFVEPIDIGIQKISVELQRASDDASYLRDLLKWAKRRLLNLHDPITEDQVSQIARPL